MSFTFGAPKTATGFTLPTSTVASTSSTGGAGDTKNQAKPLFETGGTGFVLGGTPAATTTTTGGLSFGFSSTGVAPQAATTSASFNLGSSTGIQLGGTTSTLTTTTTSAPLNFGLAPNATASKLSFPTSATPATTSVFNLGGTTATTTSTFTPILGASTASTSILNLTSSTTTATSTTASTTSTIPSTGALTYAQLEDSINKWTIDLEEQSKFFINQAKQLNAWDSLLMSNGDKIFTLNETIERVKQQQKQLDQELDFILAQQNELDELSAPLEKQLAEISVTDQSRFQTYQLSETIDSQLKQMSEDLKEIIEHLNETNKTEDVSDPIVQISKILNAHMTSLQWIDRNTSLISNQLEQISKIHEGNRKNNISF